MKNLVSVILVILIVFCVGLSYADNTSAVSMASVVGFWYGNLDADNSLLELKPDGSLSNNSNNDVLNGTWKIEGRQLAINLSDKTSYFSFNDEKGYFYNEDSEYVLSRYSMSKYATPEIKKIENISQFDGKWILYAVCDYCNVLTAEEFLSIMNMPNPWIYNNEIDLTVTIDNGTVTMFKDGIAQKCELVDNKLIYIDELVVKKDGVDNNSAGTDTYVSNDSIYLTVQDNLIYESENGVLLVFNPYLK